MDNDCSYILIGQDDGRFSGADRLAVTQDTDSAAVFEFLQEMFDEVSEWERNVAEAVASDAGIQKILEMSSGIFGNNTLVVTSASRMVLGYVQNSGPGYTLSDRVMIDGHEYVQISPRLHELAESLSADSNRTPFFSEEYVLNSRLRTLRANLFSSRGYFVARLTIAEYAAPLKGCHAELALYLARQLSLSLARTTKLLQQGETVGLSGLAEALKEGIRDRHTANQLLALTGWNKDDRYNIIVINLGDAAVSAEEYVLSLSFFFSSEFPLSQTLIIDRRIVVICSRYASPVISESFWNHLKTQIRNLDFYCGVSEEFSDITHADLFYSHALFALDQAAAGETTSYMECLTADIISCYKKEHYPRCGIIRQVEDLCEKDDCGRSELVKTLYFYLLCDRSHIQCAKELGIHRSSLQYRLNQIRDISGLPPERLSPEQKMNLLLSLRLALENN